MTNSLRIKQLKTRLEKLLQFEENKYCADCNTRNPNCVDLKFGCFLCMRCAGIHREFSNIKTINMDEKWLTEGIPFLEKHGNFNINKIYESALTKYITKPTLYSSIKELKHYIYNKYIGKLYCNKSQYELYYADKSKTNNKNETIENKTSESSNVTEKNVTKKDIPKISSQNVSPIDKKIVNEKQVNKNEKQSNNDLFDDIFKDDDDKNEIQNDEKIFENKKNNIMNLFSYIPPVYIHYNFGEGPNDKTNPKAV